VNTIFLTSLLGHVLATTRSGLPEPAQTARPGTSIRTGR
jgi:hypothetical protein